MVILNSCCCFNNVWKGSFASAIYTVILYALNVGSAISDVVAINAHLNGKYLDESSAIFRLGFTTKAHMIFSIINASISMVVVIASIILLIGLHMNNRFYLLPWIYGIIVDLFFGVIDTAFLLYSANKRLKAMIGALLALYLVSVFLIIYSLLCVVSQYKLYKEEESFDRNPAQRKHVKYEAHSGPAFARIF